ncbi:cyclin-like protein [Lophiotrema nucula]|uniref:Cyclin-like protein n=1 Tax=Lophiotrema nucula TaxID=690887 RepID=A0A6A5ZVB8_9PLEO|nr:cyclin-like protein [Lophiotrema nucula]
MQQPQRPSRAFPPRNQDENAPPQALAGKTIHQRNKSTPALSTLMQHGGLKAVAAKRTVFADVSNKTKHLGAKDDMQVGKAGGIDILKDTAVVATKEALKPAALLRPAQRPLATAAPKANAENVAPSAQTHVKLAPSEHAALPAANMRKALSKKATTIFKETQSDPVHDVASSGPTAKTNTTRKPLASRAESDENVNLRRKQTTIVEPQFPAAVADVQEQYEYLDALEEQARVLEQGRNDELAKAQALSELEADEYAYSDEEEEYFDADGYTTARSLRSRGDNTTGGVTIVLAPRVTSKSQRELDAAKQWVEQNKSPEDIEDEQWDTSMVAEYGEEIFTYMLSLEERMKPNPTYMEHQAEIQWSMRSVLMDWLVQVHNRFNLLPETLFLSVNYVDRFLSSKVVSLGKLQLVGATALFLAAKYEEINCPSVQEIVYMVDGAYTVDEILKAERFMLSMLQFELGWPGPMSFLRRISKADDYDLETRTLAKYFLEITVMDERFVGCSASFVSAGAHCLARFMLKKGDWSLAHVHYSGYTLPQLRQLVVTMLECCEAPQKHHAAVYEKYTDKRYKRASVFVETEISKGFVLPFASRESLASLSQQWQTKSRK